MTMLSTIKAEELKKLPVYDQPSNRHLQDLPGGNGCFLDPPGYPTYFTRSVYTVKGNNPSKGPQMVVGNDVIENRIIKTAEDWEGCADWDAYRAKIDARIKKLYQPLPIDHPRVKAWIRTLYAYFHSCYQDPEKGPAVTDLVMIPKSDKELSIEKRNYLLRVCIPENYRAVKVIRETYPDYEPEFDLIDNPPKWGAGGSGDWWERLDRKPSPEECPGLHGTKHPTGKTWCQMCGWQEDPQLKA